MEKGQHGDMLVLGFTRDFEIALVLGIAQDMVERGHYRRYKEDIGEREEPQLVTQLRNTQLRLQAGEFLGTEIVGEEADLIWEGLQALAEQDGTEEGRMARGMLDEVNDRALHHAPARRRRHAA